MKATRTEKTCPICETHKPLSKYRKRKTRRDGRDAICKACREAGPIEPLMDWKACPRCNFQKPPDEYHISRTRPGGRQAICKPCMVEWAQRRRDRNTPEDRANEARRKRIARGGGESSSLNTIITQADA